ncbi:MAG: 2-amino-4-ketopentanoate thiolase [Armatimonadetes bacterium]|nr:2-amino-4-ketopentanoate thiolase [Armatimonadota bacterium]
MAEQAQRGDWVRIHLVFLPAGERAPGVPADTAATSYEGWINGWTQEAARLGETVTIRTAAGREVRGRLVEITPGYHHTFGRPHPAMLAVGPSLRKMLQDPPGADGDGEA